MRRVLPVLCIAFGPCARASIAGATSDEPVARIALLANGDFRERRAPAGVDPRFALAWWRANEGALSVEAREGAAPALVVRGTQTASQPLAAYAPLARELVVRGRVRGRGVVTLVDGRGLRARLAVGASAGEDSASGGAPAAGRTTNDLDAHAFELTGADFARVVNAPLVPRFVLELSAEGEARFEELEARVAYPLPSREASRAEVLARTREIVDTWLERGADREGPQETAFLPHLFDAITGERLQTFPAGLHPLFDELLRLAPLDLDPRWNAALERYVEDFLELAVDQGSGLPRTWDTLRDEPAHGSFEIAAPLRFLIDASERGPDATRERCAQAALRIGRWILTKGVMPDGGIAPIYDSRDGEPSTQAQPLRRLDLAAQLVRLAASSGEASFEKAARDALLALEFTHDWPGTFDAIDPGFDDDFGHYGARAIAMCRARPSFASARAFALSGFERYAPLWRDGARHGGSMAADQVRCWDVLIDFADVEPRVAREVPALLDDAVRAHLSGEQYGDGAWGDVTYSRFDPRVDLSVGDLPGAPANLLRGLALATGRTSTWSEDDVRALFTGVLRSTVEAYRRPFGYLRTQRPSADRNDAYGSLRVLPALSTMLLRLND